MPLLVADHESLATNGRGEATLTMRGTLPSGLAITRTLVFSDQDYQIRMIVEVHNGSDHPLKGAPYLSLVNKLPTTSNVSRVFTGPAAFVDGELHEVKPADLAEAPQSLEGNLSWAAYETTYFMSGVIPDVKGKSLLQLSGDKDETEVTTVLSESASVIAPSPAIGMATRFF